MKRTLFIGTVLLVLLMSSGWASQQFLSFASEGGGYLGVRLRDVEMDEYRGLGLDAAMGVVVEEVVAGGPAEEAGIQAGDVIVEFLGVKVISARQFRRLVGETPPGRQVSVALLRGGSRQAVETTLAAREKAFHWKGDGPEIAVLPHFEGKIEPLDPETFSFHSFVHPGSKVKLGVSGVDLTPQMAEHLGVDSGEGVLVMEVVTDSAAEKAGVKAGDVITKVDGNSVSTLSELRQALHGGRITLEVIREGHSETLTAELAEAKKASGTTVKM